MSRIKLLLMNELKLARTSIPFHIVGIIQPAILYLLLSLILVHPTFEMNIYHPDTVEGKALIQAMEKIGSPQGAQYIKPVVTDQQQPGDLRQVIVIEDQNGRPTAVQRYGLIDSNQVKNLRDRLTASALSMWDEVLDGRAVAIDEHPWLPKERPYTLYFGMALLPFAVFLSAAILGGVLSAQDFESEMIKEYRIAPVSLLQVLAVRLIRLILTSYLAAGLLLFVMKLVTGQWPLQTGGLLLTLLPVSISAGSLGIIIGMILQRSLPSFLVSLSLALACWIFGDGFGLAAGFGGAYEAISRMTLNAHAVELIFPDFYGVHVGTPFLSSAVLLAACLLCLVLLSGIYSRKVISQQR